MIDHLPCCIELARVQKDRDELARYVGRLRAVLSRLPGAFTDGSGLQARVALLSEVRAALAGEIEPQDSAADAEEDALYRAAVARMEAAEAREDAAGET